MLEDGVLLVQQSRSTHVGLWHLDRLSLIVGSESEMNSFAISLRSNDEFNRIINR